MTCEKCGDMRVLFPTALLVLLMGRGHLPCPKCRGVSATSVAGQVQIEGYDEDEDDDECAD
jgi:hypothetical protein